MSRLARTVVFVVALAWALVLICGCSPDLRPNAKSQINLLADKWDGDPDFKIEENDPWGRPITTKVTKGDMYYSLTVRSAGPDGLPYTDDDLITVRDKKHTAASKIVGGFFEESAKGKVKGTIEGVKEGISGPKPEKTKDKDK